MKEPGEHGLAYCPTRSREAKTELTAWRFGSDLVIVLLKAHQNTKAVYVSLFGNKNH